MARIGTSPGAAAGGVDNGHHKTGKKMTTQAPGAIPGTKEEIRIQVITDIFMQLTASAESESDACQYKNVLI